MKLGRFSRSLLVAGLFFFVKAAIAAEVRSSGLMNSDPMISLRGQIVGDEAGGLQRLLQQAAAAGKTVTVFFDSEGGDVDEAMAIGRVIRAAGATTIHGYCASACVFAFLGGRERYVSPEGNLNIHRPTLAEANIAQPTVTGTQMLDSLRQYIASMTGSDAFYNAMMRVPFAAPRTLLPSEALAMGVATRRLP